jgi:hypothetical protein
MGSDECIVAMRQPPSLHVKVDHLNEKQLDRVDLNQNVRADLRASPSGGSLGVSVEELICEEAPSEGPVHDPRLFFQSNGQSKTREISICRSEQVESSNNANRATISPPRLPWHPWPPIPFKA